MDNRDLNMNKIFGESHPFSYQVRNFKDPIKDIVYRQIIEGEIKNTTKKIAETEKQLRELKKLLTDLKGML